MIAFIDQYRDCFSVEFICRVMNEHTVGALLLRVVTGRQSQEKCVPGD